MTVASLNSLEVRFQPFSKALLEFGKIATQLTNDRFANKSATAQLSSRVEHLEKLIHPAA